jgi:hypothetical protein
VVDRPPQLRPRSSKEQSAQWYLLVFWAADNGGGGEVTHHDLKATGDPNTLCCPDLLITDDEKGDGDG